MKNKVKLPYVIISPNLTYLVTLPLTNLVFFYFRRHLKSAVVSHLRWSQRLHSINRNQFLNIQIALNNTKTPIKTVLATTTSSTTTLCQKRLTAQSHLEILLQVCFFRWNKQFFLQIKICFYQQWKRWINQEVSWFDLKETLLFFFLVVLIV